MPADLEARFAGAAAGDGMPARRVSPPARLRRIERREHELTLHIFTISAGLVGVCLTAIGLIRVLVARSRVETLGEELLAGNALCFMICCVLSFWSFKTGEASRRDVLRKIIDGLFLLALVFMVVVCTLFAYAII